MIKSTNPVYIMLQYGYSLEKFHRKIKEYLVDNFSLIYNVSSYVLSFDNDSVFEITYYTDKMKCLFDIDDNVKSVFVKIKYVRGVVLPIALAKRICSYIQNGIIIVPYESIDARNNLFVTQQYGDNYSTKVQVPIPMKVLDTFASENQSKYAVLYEVKYDTVHTRRIDLYEKVTKACIKLKYNHDIDISQISEVIFDCKYYYIGCHTSRLGAMLSVSKDTNTNTIYLNIDMSDYDSLISIMTMDKVRIKISDIKSEDVSIESISYKIPGRGDDVVCEQTYELVDNMKG